MSISGFKVDGQTHKYLYSALENAPSIPTKVSDLANDSEYYTKPSSGIPASDLTSGIQMNLESLNVNLIPYPYHRTTSTINGITFTDNGDGTITADGTSTSNATFVMHGWTIADGSISVDPDVTYRITGSPEGSTASTYFVACRYYTSSQTPGSTTGTLRRDYGEGITFTGATYVSIYIGVLKGQTVTNLVFRPMLTYDGVTDNEFTEYGKSVIPYLVKTTSALQNNEESISVQAYPIGIAGGSIATFTDGADNLPLKSAIVNIEPIQSGSGTPSLDNVRPISGWTSISISHSGEDDSTLKTLTISIPSEPGVVYGGTLDVISGVLTVTYRYVTYNGSENWAAYGSGYRVSNSAFPGLALAYSTKDVSNWLTRAPYGHNPVSTTVAIENTFLVGTMMNINVSAVNSLADLKTLLSTQPLEVAYILATPLIYHCDPVKIATIFGTNRIWSDAGDVTVEYRADPTRYIQRLTGSEETDLIADNNIAENTYFMIGNVLYLSTTAIPSGGTIIPNNNCTITNLAEALNALKS